MAYEHINVRMTRSNPSIAWGFQLRQQGSELVVSYVQADSMAEKAGVKTGDIIELLFGIPAHSLPDAQSRIQSSNEVTINLRRFVAHPPSLPWTLEEQGNQVVVNHLDQGGRLRAISDKATPGYQNSFYAAQSGGTPAREEIRQTTTHKRRTETHESTGPAGQVVSLPRTQTQLEPLPYANTISSESHSNWDQDEGNVKKHFESNRTYSRTESSNVTHGPPGGADIAHSHLSDLGSTFGGVPSIISHGGAPSIIGGNSTTGSQFSHSQIHRAHPAPFTGGPAVPVHWQPPSTQLGTSTYSRQPVGATTSPPPPLPPAPAHYAPPAPVRAHTPLGAYRNGASDHGQGQGQVRAPSQPRYNSVSPGPKAYYQRNPRTERELSPQAKVEHLQYNSPLGLYSPESAAEAYKAQTGHDLSIDNYDGQGGGEKRPAYLDSATRRLIAEQEQGNRYRSPTPQQSSSFKRISNACGTPVM